MGSLAETIARSFRISNRKLKADSAWAPKYASIREGWRAVLAAIEQDNKTISIK